MESAHSTPTLTPPPQDIHNLPVSGIYKVCLSILVLKQFLLVVAKPGPSVGELLEHSCGRDDGRRCSCDEAPVR